MDAIKKRIQELIEERDKLQKEWDYSRELDKYATESFNCLPDDHWKPERIAALNRAINLLNEVKSGNLVISKAHQSEVQKAIHKVQKQIEGLEVCLSDAVSVANTISLAEELIAKGFHKQCTYDPTVCRCECHTGLDVKHFVPCCYDICPKCKQHILHGMLEEHQKICK